MKVLRPETRSAIARSTDSAFCKPSPDQDTSTSDNAPGVLTVRTSLALTCPPLVYYLRAGVIAVIETASAISNLKERENH